MIILLIFTFISGLLTILAPCIWPILPIIFVSASGGKRKPLGITAGVAVSFTFFTLLISYALKVLSFDPEVFRYIAVAILLLLGISFLIPKVMAKVEGEVSKLSGKFGKYLGSNSNGFLGGFITGLALGVVWVPCAGPILAAIATLAATQALNSQVLLLIFTYVLGLSLPLFLLAMLGQKFTNRTKGVSKYTELIQKIFGIIIIITALSIATGYDRIAQAKLLDVFPSYSNFLYEVESTDAIEEELDRLQNYDNEETVEVVPSKVEAATTTKKEVKETIPNYQKAPEIIGITKWHNTEEDLTLADLRGKVVLLKFWTFGCTNCIDTLPHVNEWYEKYKDDDFVVVGIHTPEFEYEKKESNLINFMKKNNIEYPVAQDNDFKTWRNYQNRYWPSMYLIDNDGNIRYIHYGSGKYEQTEKAINELL